MQGDINSIKQIRETFVEAINRKNADIDNAEDLPDDMGEADFSAKDSEYAKKHIANLSKMGYNQYRSTKVAFEYSNVPTGAQRMLYNPQKNQFEIWEKGDDTIIPMGIAKPGKEAERLYERTYGKKNLGFNGNADLFGSAEEYGNRNNQLYQNRENGKRDVQSSQSERREYTSGRSGANLPESNNGKSITNEPSSNDGGFSVPKFSTKDSEYMKAAESGDTETAQRMVDEAAKEAGYTERLYHQTDNDFTIFDTNHPGAGSRDNETPYGIFMKKSNRNIGLKGSKQMPLFAKITNPLVAKNREDLVYKLRKISVEYSEIKDKLSDLDNEYQERFDNAKKAWRDYLTEYRKGHPNESRSEIYNDKTFNELFDAEDKIIDEWTAEATKLDKQAKKS